MIEFFLFIKTFSFFFLLEFHFIAYIFASFFFFERNNIFVELLPKWLKGVELGIERSEFNYPQKIKNTKASFVGVL